MLTGFLEIESIQVFWIWGGGDFSVLLASFQHSWLLPRDQNGLGMWLLKPDVLPILRLHNSWTQSIKLNKPLRYKGYCSIGCKVFVKTFAPVCWLEFPGYSAQCLQDTRWSHLLFLLPSVQQAPVCGQQSSLPVQNELPAEAKADGAAQWEVPVLPGDARQPLLPAEAGPRQPEVSQLHVRCARPLRVSVAVGSNTVITHLCEFCSQETIYN